MLKTVKFLLASTFFSIYMCINIYGASNVIIDGTPLDTPAPPVNIDGHIYVPARSILEALGSELTWDAQRQMVFATGQGPRGETFKFTFKIGSTDVVFNAEDNDDYFVADIVLSAPPVIREDATMLPVRGVANLLLKDVDWDAATQTAAIKDYVHDAGEAVIYASAFTEEGIALLFQDYMGMQAEGKPLYWYNSFADDVDFLPFEEKVTYLYAAADKPGEYTTSENLTPGEAKALFEKINAVSHQEYLKLTIENGIITKITDDRAFSSSTTPTEETPENTGAEKPAVEVL